MPYLAFLNGFIHEAYKLIPLGNESDGRHHLTFPLVLLRTVACTPVGIQKKDAFMGYFSRSWEPEGKNHGVMFWVLLYFVS